MNKGKGKSKIPTIKQLNQEYAQVLSGKKTAYAEYREARKQMQDYLIARKNVEAILGGGAGAGGTDKATGTTA